MQNAPTARRHNLRVRRNEWVAHPTIGHAAITVTPSPTLLHHLVPLDYARATSLLAERVPLPSDFPPGPRLHPLKRVPGPRQKGLMFALILLALGALIFALVSEFGIAGLQEKLVQLDPTVAIAAMAVLPLFGFSIAVVYVVAGAKFGFWAGGAVIAGISAFHLLASHWIGRGFLHQPLQRMLARHQKHLPTFPPSENRAIAVMAALVPGPPYFARNYMLALTTIPLRVYFWVCLPLYVLRSYVTLSLGDLTRHGSGGKLLLLGVIYGVKLAICAYLLQRLRRRLKGYRPAG